MRESSTRFHRRAGALTAVVLTAVLVPGSPAHARATETEPAASTVAGADESASLAAAADPAGNVRAILALKVPFKPESMKRAADRTALRSAIRSAGAAVETDLRGTAYKVNRRYDFLPYLAVTAPVAAIEKLRQSGRIAGVQVDHVEYPGLAESIGIVGAAEATAHGFDGTAQVVAILDTGVDTAHPMFAGKIVGEACFSSNNNCPNGTSSQIGPGSGVPCTFVANCNHGTHVAGIAAGRRGGSITIDGVAPAAGVLAVNIFSRSTICFNGAPVCAVTFGSDMLAGLEHVINQVQNGMNVAAVNMSIVSSFSQSTDCDTDARKPAIDTLRSFGVATVISSGNNSSNTGVSSPACISSAIAVGNTTKSDTVAASSDSSPQVELLAPGTFITSAVPGGGLAVMSGTSMAAPHVAGAWAVYRERFPSSTVNTVLNALQFTGVSVTDPDNGVTKPRINISAAMAHYGYVVADQPTTPTYTPGNPFSGNSAGGTNQIDRLGVGSYRVRMPGVGPSELASGQVGGGTVHVTAYGNTTRRCKVNDWFRSGVELHALVLCHNTSGAAADAAFTLFYKADETVRDNDFGYSWVTATGSGATPLLWQANSSSATAVNTVTHTDGSGLYTVLFPGLTDGNGNAQVTAQGGGSEYCKLRGVSVVAAGAQVQVACYNASGTLTDSNFDVSYRVGDPTVIFDISDVYGLANQPTNTNWYDVANQFDMFGPVRARRAPNLASPGSFLTGVYEFQMPNTNHFFTNVTVTALGTNANTCNVESWSGFGDVMATVRCRTPSGTLANTQFSLLFTTE